jgi:hypothetical protein
LFSSVAYSAVRSYWNTSGIDETPREQGKTHNTHEEGERELERQ